jgi:hypothetical protein
MTEAALEDVKDVQFYLRTCLSGDEIKSAE